MELDAHSDLASLLTALVTPRPIAWVTTVDANDVVNLAPFSYFNLVSDAPPIVMFVPVRRPDGSKKDTLLNLEVVPEFVLNLVTESTADACNLSSKQLPHGESELELARLTPQPSAKVRPPRVGESPAHLECVVRQRLPLGDHPGAATVVFGDIVHIHVADAMLTNGRPDLTKLKTMGRMGGKEWCRTTDTRTLDRPQ